MVMAVLTGTQMESFRFWEDPTHPRMRPMEVQTHLSPLPPPTHTPRSPHTTLTRSKRARARAQVAATLGMRLCEQLSLVLALAALLASFGPVALGLAVLTEVLFRPKRGSLFSIIFHHFCASQDSCLSFQL
jgi:hypothetical protein